MEAEATAPQPPPSGRAQLAKERGPAARDLLLELFKRLELPAEIILREGGEEIALHAKMGEGAEAAGLAGDRPTMQEPIAYLLSKMVNRGAQEGGPRAYVKLSFGDTPPPLSEMPVEDTDPELVALGKELAERAKQIRKTLVVGPMGARDRRSIHVAVKEAGGATTRSEGEGLSRRVLIIPDGLPKEPEGQAAAQPATTGPHGAGPRS
jgi:spoIIIJ-associated protein